MGWIGVGGVGLDGVDWGKWGWVGWGRVGWSHSSGIKFRLSRVIASVHIAGREGR